MRTPWILGFSVIWGTHCMAGCCKRYVLFGKVNGRIKVLKRFSGIGQCEYSKLALGIIKYFMNEHRKIQ